ncbi:MAG: 50S ribosomal protein L19 [Thaumarchaeota archaeon 13_1_40CM_38_12]|nr:MAG: 50S ribosomal protein L19 [Thaumarchaeota archaeon 13_1_40CM_38_12]OLC34382.1 MAG: 50S ribosomal protein L19 [Thaumarchaeota archaeon 13_1_40CM_4_38_7]OLC94353.1 MAG: 50S ribosomal protein L19 [Thaumarchaeota archaeon 13_1_40CM_3_38_6]OLD40513.1 MAG: 50S ribosomal protein L19 [Thaumarchaeota archaeon 13_1_40CM_2_39_4]TLY04838.1 MAG: 50S ribosomal protein L19e [Nitrososphaerota archaeon]
MVVNLRTKRQLVSRILGIGVDRVKFDPEYLDDVADAITRDNIRSLITAKIIQIRPIKGTSKGRAYFKKLQRGKRGTKQGSKKGAKGARIGKKEVYVNKIRAMRHQLKVSKSRKEVTNNNYWKLYKQVRGNQVRNLAHLRTLIEEVRSKK